MHRTLVLGIGNVLMGDDAIGPTVVAHLEARFQFPPEVKLLELGSGGIDLALHLTGMQAAVLIDAIVDEASPPGAVRVLDGEALCATPAASSLDPHSTGLGEALLLAGPQAQVSVIGVVVANCGLGAGLSAPVRAALPAMVELVVMELRRFGVRVAERIPPASPDLWWER